MGKSNGTFESQNASLYGKYEFKGLDENGFPMYNRINKDDNFNERESSLLRHWDNYNVPLAIGLNGSSVWNVSVCLIFI